MTERACLDCIHPAEVHVPGESGCYEDECSCRVTFYPYGLSPRQTFEQRKALTIAVEALETALVIVKRQLL